MSRTEKNILRVLCPVCFYLYLNDIRDNYRKGTFMISRFFIVTLEMVSVTQTIKIDIEK
jgi:hypothetical protein